MALCLSAILSTAPAVAEKISLNDLNDYINGLPVVKTHFTQVNADKSKSKGQMYISRPGKMRFEYAAPNPALVIAAAGSVAVYDDKTKEGPAMYPLKKTPLSLILAKDVDLKSSGMVKKHYESGKYTVIVAKDPKGKTKGQIELMFTNNPIELKQWVVTDQSRQKTSVYLGRLKPQKKLSSRLFDIKRPRRN